MPRKLGQHFLIRDSILETLAVAACNEHTPRVVEIGSGKGALTRHVLQHTGELHAIEIDRSLVEYLRRKYASDLRVHVHLADVLSIDIAQWGPAVVIGNLPYYITSPILEKFLALDAQFPIAVFLMQSEVADRILASPNTRAYGYLSVATQLVCQVEMVRQVPASAFVPPPKVDSAAIRLIRKREVPNNLALLLTFVSRCFAHKRKTLRNNLSSFYGQVVNALPEAGLRAEQLTTAQFMDLHKRLSEPGG